MKYPIENYNHFTELTGKIIGCAMEVHSTLGNGFQELIYQRSLALEMKLKNIEFERELEMPIVYKNITVGGRRVDFFVENKIMVEIKAINTIDNIHLAQAKNYLEAYNMNIGLLLNFGSNKLEFKRIYNSNFKINSKHN
ncbi:MAG: GxxExxY protein [Sphingobacterium mizutaii]|nr:GxxExxY protein [Sphingobacterium mizutaii]